MVEITTSTPRDSITIAGETFTVPQPYLAGHVLVAGEASALNQTFAENVRNNLASKIKALKEAGTFDAQVFQGSVDDYAESYEFGVRTGGGRTSDPTRAEALNIARELVRGAISKKGIKLADVPAKKITELAAGVIDKGDEKSEQIWTLAKQRVAAAGSLEGLDLSGVDLTPEPAAPSEPSAPSGVEEDATAPAAKRGKAA